MNKDINLPKAVIFDLDGTLMTSTLDFALIRKEIGCSPNNDILQFVSALDEAERRSAEAIILEHEMRDAESSRVIDGVPEVLTELERLNIKLAIVTRNSATATQAKLSNASISISHVVTREQTRPKPSPDALIFLAKHWDIPCQRCLYVGDYRYDIEAARNAGMHAVWFANDLTTHPDYAGDADYYFNHYAEFMPRLDQYWRNVAL